MKKYDSYKDSNIQWIGEIPNHWGKARLKYNSRIKTGYTPPMDNSANYSDDGMIWVKPDNLDYFKPIIESREKISIQGVKKQNIISKDSVLLCCIGSIGKFGIAGVDLLTNQQICGITYVNDLVPSYGKYLIYCSDDELNRHANGNVVRILNATSLSNILYPIPPISEQTQIANYLDHKTTQIEHLIAKKKQFIQLLEEERVAVINQAVNKGLDPSVPMKDSGIEWLGQIPKHWELKRMKYLCDVTTGGKDTENREDDGEYPFFVRSQTIERISTYSFDGEAILTAGDGVGVCKVWHYVNEKFDFHQRVYMMCNFKPVLGKYLFYYLKENFGKEVMKLSAKSTVDSLRRPMFQNFMVCFGSLEEQKQIISHIEKEELRIETLITKYHQEIELLKEYKTALISEVVTGKVDVRNEILN